MRFPLDLAALAPALSYFLPDDKVGSSIEQGRSVKVLRMLKLLKLLRVLRAVRIYKRYEDTIMPLFVITSMIVLMAWLMHTLACFWYLIGTSDSHFLQGRHLPGW